MTTTGLKELAEGIERHLNSDGSLETAVPGMTFYRASAPSEQDAVVYVPSLCVIAQGAKEVAVGGQAYHYDPAQSLLVSVDLPARTRVIEASPSGAASPSASSSTPPSSESSWPTGPTSRRTPRLARLA